MIFGAIMVKNVNVFVMFCNLPYLFMIFAAIMVKSVHTITDDSQNKSIEIDSSLTWGYGDL